MCAIAGMLRGKQADAFPAPEKILSTMQRRGPDSESIFVSEEENPLITLYHARLAVIDPENGRRPMLFPTSGKARYAIVYNGELYNTAELKAELETIGHSFQTTADTEVVLHSFIEWKEKCLARFNGIFAFAVWDNEEKQLFLARDRMGVKPLFYMLDGGRFLFASEIKTLLAFPGVKPQIDSEGIAELMLCGPGRTPGCGVFKGVQEFKSAQYAWILPDGQPEIHRYWKLTPHVHTESFEETAAHVRSLVLDAISRQLVSDVPIGTFLSGGLDSSLISTAACDMLQQS